MRTALLFPYYLAQGGKESISKFISRVNAAISGFVAEPELSPLSITESEYESLVFYENRVYTLDNGAVYNRSTLVTPPVDVYADGDIHVATTGNDGTGDGSEGNPYLTLSKAIDMTPSGGGITIWLHGGTFTNNDSGTGYFLKSNKTFTLPIKIKGVQGSTSIITSTAGIRVVYFNGTSSNVIMQNLTFKAIGTTQHTVDVNASLNFEFRDCIFDDDESGSVTSIKANGAGGFNLAVKRCSFTSTAGSFYISVSNMNSLTVIGNSFNTIERFVSVGTGCGGAFNINNNDVSAGSDTAIGLSALNASGSEITIKRNSIVCSGNGIAVTGGSSTNSVKVNVDFNVVEVGAEGIVVDDYVDGGSINGNDVVATGLLGIAAPRDGHSTTTFSTKNLDVSYNRVLCTGNNGHAFLYSSASDGNTTTFNSIDARNGGAYGVVGKGDNHIFNNNIVYGGGNACLLLKGADGYTVQKNVFIQEVDGGWCFRFDDAAATNVVTQNKFIATQEGAEMLHIPATMIGDNNLVDENGYYVGDGATWGDLFDVFPDDLSGVRAAWLANYATGQANDLKSYEISEID